MSALGHQRKQKRVSDSSDWHVRSVRNRLPAPVIDLSVPHHLLWSFGRCTLAYHQ